LEDEESRDSYNEDDDEESYDPSMITPNGVIESYALFNPHATFEINSKIYKATSPGWPKWNPADPTSPHWYNPETLRSLIAAYVSQEREGGRERTVREFVSEFRGLSSTVKQKLVTEDFKGLCLHDLVKGEDIDNDKLTILLEAMQEHTTPPKPAALGIIGEDHMKQWMLEHAGIMERSFKYARRLGKDGMPHVLEVAIGIHKERQRRIITGLNWASTLKIPMEELSNMLGDMHIDSEDPVTLVVHVARPQLDFVDRGKGRLAEMVDLDLDIDSALESVAKEWKRIQKHRDKKDRVSQQRIDQMNRKNKVTIKEVAYDVMEEAYLKASGNQEYEIPARMVFYAARPQILTLTGLTELNYGTFIGNLKSYIEDYNLKWKIVFDARGHLIEPHTGKMVGLGGLAVRNHIARFTGEKIDEMPPNEQNKFVDTEGPCLRYGGVLFIEKEGFYPLLEKAQIRDRYDLAIASTKGMPVSALFELLEAIRKYGPKVFLVHDFDKSAFNIVKTVKTGTRGSVGSHIEVVDLGFRLEDIKGLEREPVSYSSDPRDNLEANGATEEEIDILYQGHNRGERVELNAMSAPQFIAWLKRKLTLAGVKKVIPDKDILAAGYRRQIYLRRLAEKEDELRVEMKKEKVEIPSGLQKRVRQIIKKDSSLSWDMAINQVVEEMKEEEDGGNV
jgi:hypothetical protein